MIKFRRQGGGSSSSVPASAPSSLAYGEPAVASDGTIYTGDGLGNVVSKVKNAETAANAEHATNADMANNATNAVNATNSIHAEEADDATNGLWEFVGTYLLDGWTGTDGNYEQTVLVNSVYGSKSMTASARLSDPLTEQTDNFQTNETKLEALSIINKGHSIPGNGNVTIKCAEKPSCDLDVHWYVKL